jgi:hypothetical protein
MNSTVPTEALTSEQPLSFAAIWRAELGHLGRIQSTASQATSESQTAAALKALSQQVDGLEKPMAALCLSGGGIRSASFALGVLQALARVQLLGHFDYLSTVSGGGYIGSWLSAWRLAAQNDQRVFAALNERQDGINEAPEIRGIRADSNYLTPTLGLLSADTWTLVALYIRNLLLNWLMFLPFFAGCLFVPRLAQATLDWIKTLPENVPIVPLALIVSIAGLALGLTVAIYGRYGGKDLGIKTSAFLGWVLVPLATSSFSLAVVASKNNIKLSVSCYALSGIVAGLLIYGLALLLAASALGPRRKAIRTWDALAWLVTGMLVGLGLGVGLHQATTSAVSSEPLVVLGMSGYMLAVTGGDLLYVGLASFSPRGDDDREWLARSAGWLMAAACTWGLVAALVLFSPGLLLGLHARLASLATVATLSGLTSVLFGKSAKTAATVAGEIRQRLSLTQIVSIASLIFALCLGAALSLVDKLLEAGLQDWVVRASVVAHFEWSQAAVDLLACVALLMAGFIFSYFINVNRFSLHALYRNRLVRAFLGSARARAEPRRAPDSFTGFDSADNCHMTELASAGDPQRLLHVINMTLNVVAANNPAWQERKAESFTVTPLSSGNARVGYRPTAYYGGMRGLTLGTAMAISGAAVSPNQGYNSSPLVGFLLMLFNVRLGWWLGNPAQSQFNKEGPVFSLLPALQELAGATTDTRNWVYLSDGGHFENLGLYEMVRRRCRFIVISDAGCDPTCSFEDLGNAARKCYIDFGVSIDFEQLSIEARQSPPVAGARCAIGTVHYPDSEQPGWLLYIKPTYYASTEPVDVRSYAASHQEFPHESTTEQWFSESQLEAYRALGAHIFETVCGSGSGSAPMNLGSLREAAQQYVKDEQARQQARRKGCKCNYPEEPTATQ